MDYAKESLRLHGEWKGKIEVVTRVPVENKDDLSLAYTPGVAQPCLEIQKDVNKSYELTRRWNMCLVVTDGSAVLGLGNIGPEAGMPVMEGKCVLFKAFGDVDAFPLCIKSNDVDEIVNTIYMISGSFGGVNLEDISAPRCFEIEKKLKEKCDIPIFHDDQHGTAIITLAGLTNALKVVGKKKEDVRVVMNGAGAAAISCLTEPFYFQGSDQYLWEIASEVDIPVLRKDFVVDDYMIVQAAAYGAAAVLLICALLDDRQLREYREMAEDLGMDALVEAHDAEEVERALKSGARIIGVNNRDLKTFEVDMENSIRLRKLAPDDVIFVSESGIRTAEDIRKLHENRIEAVLIGETLMRSADNKAALEAVLSDVLETSPYEVLTSVSTRVKRIYYQIGRASCRERV